MDRGVMGARIVSYVGAVVFIIRETELKEDLWMIPAVVVGILFVEAVLNIGPTTLRLRQWIIRSIVDEAAIRAVQVIRAEQEIRDVNEKIAELEGVLPSRIVEAAKQGHFRIDPEK